jgi:hypothetical protein
MEFTDLLKNQAQYALQKGFHSFGSDIWRFYGEALMLMMQGPEAGNRDCLRKIVVGIVRDFFCICFLPTFDYFRQKELIVR